VLRYTKKERGEGEPRHIRSRPAKHLRRTCRKDDGKREAEGGEERGEHGCSLGRTQRPTSNTQYPTSNWLAHSRERLGNWALSVGRWMLKDYTLAAGLFDSAHSVCSSKRGNRGVGAPS